MLPRVPDRLPPPGPSFLREQAVRIGDAPTGPGWPARPRRPTAGGSAILWVADDDGVVTFRDVAPDAGPPPDPPLARLGPAISGALSGLILEDAGRLQMRLGLIAPPERPDRPWRARWRSGRPSGSSRRAPRRCARTSSPRPS